MNMRCMYCQTMFGVSRDVMLVALQTMEAEKLTHYDIHCPKCRRANRVERRKLEMANPNWKQAVKAMAKEAEKASAPAKAKDAPAKKSAAKKAPAKKSSAKKKAAAKSAAKKKSTVKKGKKAKAK